MRLYLSSYKWGNHPEKIHELVGAGPKRVALVMNAKDAYDETIIQDKSQEDMSTLESWGYSTERLDLKDYFGRPDEMAAKLKAYDFVWVFGGNVFVLRRAMKYSGFDVALASLLKDDTIAYGGFSAGACVLTPTLRGIEFCDDPHEVPDGYQKDVVWEGLDVVPYSIAPHYQSDHPESSMIDDMVAYFDEHGMPYETLRDGEAIIINGDQPEKLT